MFTSARIQLTAWYTLALMALTICVSGLLYVRITQVFEREYRRIELRLQAREETGQMPVPLPPGDFRFKRILPEDLIVARRLIFTQLVVINLLIWVGFAGVGYVLSGLTLRPIEIAHKQQQQFIADAAHELKTPITALRTSLEVNLLDKKLPSAARKILTENLEDVQGLETLSESLLTLARAEEKNCFYTNVDLNEVVTAALKQVHPIARLKKTAFVSHSKVVPAMVHADSTQLTQAIVVLLENALQYDLGQHPVEVSLEGSHSKVWVSVTDKGVGIAEDQQPQIFERFYRVDQARSAQQKGHGLGLAVARKIVSEHGGTLTVTSQLGQGSTFTLTLPLQAA